MHEEEEEEGKKKGRDRGRRREEEGGGRREEGGGRREEGGGKREEAGRNEGGRRNHCMKRKGRKRKGGRHRREREGEQETDEVDVPARPEVESFKTLNVFKISEETFTLVMLKNSSLSSMLSASWETGPSSLVMLSRSGTISSTKAVVVIRVSCEKVRVGG